MVCCLFLYPFQPNYTYYWTHKEAPVSNPSTDVAPGLLAPMWPPVQSEDNVEKPGLKYTEAGINAETSTESEVVHLISKHRKSFSCDLTYFHRYQNYNMNGPIDSHTFLDLICART